MLIASCRTDQHENLAAMISSRSLFIPSATTRSYFGTHDLSTHRLPLSSCQDPARNHARERPNGLPAGRSKGTRSSPKRWTNVRIRSRAERKKVSPRKVRRTTSTPAPDSPCPHIIIRCDIRMSTFQSCRTAMAVTPFPRMVSDLAVIVKARIIARTKP